MPLPSSLLWAPLLAFICSILLHLAALRLFPRIGLMDFPERYGLSRPRLPYPTGIITFFLSAGFFLWFQPPSTQTLWIIGAVSLLEIVCFLDDRTPLSPFARLAAQIVVFLLLFANGVRIFTITNPLEDIVGSPVIPLDTLNVTVPLFGTLSMVGALFSLLWLGLTTNALNWFDGIPGQANTLATIGFVIIGAVALLYGTPDPQLATISFTLAALALGALLFDFPPPRTVLGDSGAMFYGLMLGTLTIYAGKGKVATAFLVLGVPLIDLFLVIVRRLWKGRSVFQGDAKNEHLHHRLLQKGWSPRSIILLTATIGTLFGVTALFLNTFWKFVAGVVLFLVMLGLSVYSRPGKGLWG